MLQKGLLIVNYKNRLYLKFDAIKDDSNEIKTYLFELKTQIDSGFPKSIMEIDKSGLALYKPIVDTNTFLHSIYRKSKFINYSGHTRSESNNLYILDESALKSHNLYMNILSINDELFNACGHID